MNSPDIRSAGILLHITSLPSRYGIGDLGHEARKAAKWMQRAGITLWQVLPLGPTGFGNSPYAPRSTFAGNELLISLDILREEGLLDDDHLDSPPDFPSHHVDFPRVIAWKLPLLKRAAATFLGQGTEPPDFQRFCREQDFWLDDYALFMVLYERYGDARWFSHWPKPLANRKQAALDEARRKQADRIAIWKVLQYFFDRQWKAFKDDVNALSIRLIGDVPIFVASDSADTWSNLHLFKTDEQGRYRAVSGVPPDFFSATGQLWGNPVYDWPTMKKDGYRWWMQRLERLFGLTDILRIDHFRGFDAYYEIPSGETTAQNGTWVKADGAAFFRAVRQRFGEVPIIAEDLGVMTPSVERLRRENHFPGMKICQFGFSHDKAGMPNWHDDFLPHNYDGQFVAYTGTHDNDTTRGWFDKLGPEDRDSVRRYLSCPDEEVVWAMIRALMLSHANTVIVPMQDILEKGSEARMNIPSTCNDHNWSWQMTEEEFSDYALSRLAFWIVLSGRSGLSGDEEERHHLAEQKARLFRTS